MSFLIYHKDHQHHRHDRYLFYNYFSSILFLSLLLLLRDDFALYYLVFFLFFFPLVCLVLVYCFVFCFICYFCLLFLHIISRTLKQWVRSVEITLMNEHLVSVSYSFGLIWYVILLQTNNFTLALNKTYIQQDSSLQVCWSFTFYLLNF